MALEPFWAALADAPSLSLAQQRTTAEVVARRGDPATAARFFARPEVTAETRALVIRKAYDKQLIKAVLATPVVTTELLLTAAEKLGPEAVLIEFARTRWDLEEALLLLIQRLDHAAARRVAEAWTHFGPELRTALIDAAVRAMPEKPDSGIATDDRRKAERDVWLAKVEAWHDDIWTLMSSEPAKSLWPTLIARGRDHEGSGLIVNMLLSRADELPDGTLLACLKSAFSEAEPELDAELGEWEARMKLERLADIISRHPRALLLHGTVLNPLAAALAAAVIAHMTEEGVSEWEWSTFESLAAVCTSPDVLSGVAKCLTTASLPSWYGRRPDADWIAGRSKAADALVASPLLPVDALAAVTPFLGSATAARFVKHADDRVREAAEGVVAEAVMKTEYVRSIPSPRKESSRPSVPSDEVLAESRDPRAELAAYLPLKGPAAHKRQVARAIAASRFADAGLLRELPAALTLASESQAHKVAALLQEELGDDAQAWDAFAGKVTRLAPNAVKSLSALIGEARGGTTLA